MVHGTLSADPVAGAETVWDGGWIVPGLVDAHCHVGLGEHGAIALDEAIAQAETERDAGALLLRDAGSPTDTRSLDGPRRPAAHHPPRPASGQAEALPARVRHRAGGRITAARGDRRAGPLG